MVERFGVRMVNRSILILLILSFLSCTKEVQIDIPQYDELLNIEGRIEVGKHPIVFISKNLNIYESTSLASYINSFVYDAEVYVKIGEDSVKLEPVLLNDLSNEALLTVSEILSVEPEEASLLPMKVYTTLDSNIQGRVNEFHELSVYYEDKFVQGRTYIPSSVSLDSLLWASSPENSDYGTSVGSLSDPVGTFNAYKWEVKRINLKNGVPKDLIFKRPRNGVFNDDLIDGMTIELDFPNPMKRKDSTHLKEFRRFFKIGDTVVVKFSTMEENVFEFYKTMRAQQSSSGNPFSTPVNVKTNLTGPAIGIWAGFSPSMDTLICLP